MRNAILSYMYGQINRMHGGLTYRMTQIITGHGCFGTFLYHIEKVAIPECGFCNNGTVDDAQHTLQTCLAWENARRKLREVIGQDLSLPEVINQILKDKVKWNAFLQYCEEVMKNKEDKEREEERLRMERVERTGG